MPGGISCGRQSRCPSGFLLETNPRSSRRTVYLSGDAAGATVTGLVEGRPWHDSRYLRMVVDPRGHLVTMAGEAPLAGGTVAPASVTVTTYGLDDDDLAVVRYEWTARWDTVRASS